MNDSIRLKRKIQWIKGLQKSIHLGCFMILVAVTIILVKLTLFLNFMLQYFLYVFLQVAQCLVKYSKGPTYISSKILDQKEATFPAMTICPENDGYKLDVLQAHGIKSIDQYNNNVNLNWTSNQTGVSEAQLFELATFRLDELVKELYIRLFKANPVRKY